MTRIGWPVNWPLKKKYVAVCLIITSLLLAACAGQVKNKQEARRFIVEKKWVRDTLSKEYLGYRLPHRMTPIVTENLVIIGNAFDGVAAYDRKTGHKVWKLMIDGGLEAGAQLVDDKLYFGASDGKFYSLQWLTGKINWTYAIKSEGLSKPTVQAGVVYFISGTNIVYALDAKSGKKLWTYSRRDASNLSVRSGSAPTISENRLFVGFSDGYLVALEIKSGSLLWELALNKNRKFRDVDAQPIVEGSRIYVSSFDGGLFCIDKARGEILWQSEFGGVSAVTLTKNSIYYATSSGQVMALEKTTGKTKWSYKIQNGIGTQPKLFKGLIVFGESSGAFRALSLQEGKEVGSFTPGHGIQGAPYVDQNTGESYFISSSGNIFAIKMGWRKFKRDWPWEVAQ